MELSPETLGRVGLVLSGGAGKAFFHVGALLVIAQEMGKVNVPITYISAVSAGALAAVKFLEVFPKADALEEIALTYFARPPFKRKRVGKLLKDRSFFDNAPLWELMKHIDLEKVMNSPTELHIITTDVATRSERVFSSKIEEREVFRKSILASTAMKHVFDPVQIHDAHYMDGGEANPIPIENAVRAGCNTVFVVDCSPRRSLRILERFKRKIRLILMRPRKKLLAIGLRWSKGDVARLIKEGKSIAEYELQNA